MKKLSEKYGKEMIYDYYVRVYDMTGKEVDDKVLVKISEKYGFDSLEFDIIFSVLYMTMIAEENKRYIRLRKRIKRLGVFFVIIEDQSVYYSANFMRGMK